MYQREVAKTLNKILKGTQKVCLEREIPPSQGILLLTQVGCPISIGGQQEAKYHNLAEHPGAGQVHSPVISQLTHQLY